MTSEAVAKAIEKRTQQRQAARKEAAKRGVETRRHNREAQGKPKPAETQNKADVAPQAPEAQKRQQPVAGRQAKRPERNVAQDKQASGAMVTVARAPRGVRCESPNALVTQ